MRVVAIITSRWESKRLPGKALVDINGKPMLQRIVDRVRMSKVDDVVVATTPSSVPIIAYCRDNNIKVSIGDEEDIVSRLYTAAVENDADVIIRVWGDSPLVNPRHIDFLVDLENDCGYGYAFNPKLPKGTASARLTFQALKLDYEYLKDDDRHWYHHFYMMTDYGELDYDFDFSYIDLSVDDEESLALARQLCIP